MSRDAVVVGINRYQYLSNLQAPAQDAEAIAHCLHAYGDFRVNRLPEVIDQQRPKVGVTTPVTRQELETALVQLFKPKGKHIPSTALFYYSGHGLQKDAGIQEGYLATSDANPSQGMYGLSLFWLRRLLQESPVRQRIILLDCCHSGELLNFLEADPGANPGTDRLFMAASREYEAAYESLEGAYSVFTQALLTGLDPQAHGTVTNYALTSWVSHALKGELQQPLFECSGREIILTSCRVASEGTAATSTPDSEPVAVVDRSGQRCPFPGLRPLTGDDLSLLPSRTEIIARLYESLWAYTHVTLTGVSGSGKTSLLQQELPAHSQTQSWQLRYVTPGHDPLQSLALTFVTNTAIGIDRASQLHQAIALLEQGGIGLVRLCDASLGTAEGTLLVIDQLESLLQPSLDGHNGSDWNQMATPTAGRFLTTLAEAARQQPERVRILWCVRQDYLAEWTHLTQVLMPDMPMDVVTLPPPTSAQIHYGLTEGLAQVGYRLEPHLLYTLSLELGIRNAEPQEDQAAALPLLQLVLHELWQRSPALRSPGQMSVPVVVSAGTYAHVDGVRGVIHRHADAVLARLSPAERAIARRLFLALVHLQTGQAMVPRRVRKDDLLARVQATPGARSVLETLVATRLLVLDRQDVEVSHPELVRSWPPLQAWVAERRDSLYLQQQVEQAAHEWEQTATALSHPVRVPLPLEKDRPWTTPVAPSLWAASPQGQWLRGDLLAAAVRHYEQCPHDFSPLAQRYLALSHREQRRLRQQTQRLRAIVPLVLLLALGSGIWQYRSQVRQEHQLRVARSRERAAIAQTILQDPQQDPTAALLISRVALEQDWRTPEAQASLRTALQRLQPLVAHQGELPPLQGAGQPIIGIAFIQPDMDFWQTTILGKAPPTTAQPQVLVTLTDRGQIQYWRLETGTALKQPFWLPIASSAVGVAPSQRQLSPGGLVRSSTPPFPTAAVPLDPLTGFAISPEGRWLATTQFSGLITLYRLQPDQTFEPLHTLPQTGLVRQLAFSPLSNRLLGIEHDRVLIWDLKTGELVQVLQGHQGAITQAHFSHDGWQVVTSSWDQTVALWEVNTGKQVQQWSHPDGVTTVGFRPDDRALAWAGQDGTLVTIALTNPRSPHVVQMLGTPIVDVQYDASGRSLITTQANGLVQFWDVETGTEQGQLPPLSAQRAESASNVAPLSMQQVLQSPDGRYLTTLQGDGRVTAWTASWESLLALARDRSLRQLTPDECWQYLKLSATACPVLSLGDAVQVANPLVMPRGGADLATSGQGQSPHRKPASQLISLISGPKHP